MTTLYRAYDEADRLLYVGITDDDLERRLNNHARYATWPAYLDRLTIQIFPDRASACAAELAAIRSEKPLHNIHCKSGADRHAASSLKSDAATSREGQERVWRALDRLRADRFPSLRRLFDTDEQGGAA
jgi:predicted GIY-YIG superfamily endonuclease